MKITVLGCGKSGYAAAKLAKRLGHEVFVSESGSDEKYNKQIDYFETEAIDYELGGNTEKVLNCDLCVASPGIPPHAEVIKQLESNDIEIISEMEYAFRQLKGYKSLIAVTGTNGKTTTVNMIHHVLKSNGHKSLLCGNVGTPLSEYVGMEEGALIVAEVSSYQLDRIVTFRPDIAIITNLSPDHLSYHGSYVEYFMAKWKITSMQTDRDVLVLNDDDVLLGRSSSEAIKKLIKSSKYQLSDFSSSAQKAYFSLKQYKSEEYKGAYLDGEVIGVTSLDDIEANSGGFMQTSQLPMPGSHNIANSMAAILACRYLELSDEDIRDAISSFSGVEHRIELVRSDNSIRWYNDSKATNINATWYALSSFKADVIWLAGGEGEGNDYSELDSLVDERVKEVICFGKEASNIFNHFSGKKKISIVEDIEEAVIKAYRNAESGDTVLLSPACKSFDQFMNFEHRGEKFKRLVKEMYI
ncbi:MAG: UDP-N-acetylmuramoyl-L-alanine--D-glutamate ligase [Candidatus Kapaibacteriales bacterium]